MTDLDGNVFRTQVSYEFMYKLLTKMYLEKTDHTLHKNNEIIFSLQLVLCSTNIESLRHIVFFMYISIIQIFSSIKVLNNLNRFS